MSVPQIIPNHGATSVGSASFTKGANQNQTGPVSGKQGNYLEGLSKGPSGKINPCYGAPKRKEYGAAAPSIKRGQAKP